MTKRKTKILIFSNTESENAATFYKDLKKENPAAQFTLIINEKHLSKLKEYGVEAEFLTYSEYKWARNPFVAVLFILKLLTMRFDIIYMLHFFKPMPILYPQRVFMFLTRAKRKIGVHPDGRQEDLVFPLRFKPDKTKRKTYYEEFSNKKQDSQRKRMLYITATLPYPPNYGGNIRMFGLLKYFNDKFDVTLITRSGSRKYFKETLKYCRKMIVATDNSFNMIFFSQELWVKLIAMLFLRGPMVKRAHSSKSLKSAIEDELKNGDYDIIQVEHAYMATHIPKNLEIVKVIDKHNIDSNITYRAAKAAKNPFLKFFYFIESRRMKKFETRMSEKFDVILFDTENDRDLFRTFSPRFKDIRAIPTGVDIDGFNYIGPSAGTCNLVSIGTMSWQPNVDGILWFYDSVYKDLKKQYPEMKFFVIGHRPLYELEELGQIDPSVIVTGFVDDVTPYLEDSAVFVVPLRIGSGMRIKILNAMSWGFPVVTTTVGCEGMKVKDGENIMVGDDPETFGRHIIELIENREKAKDIGLKARKMIEEVYDWKVIYGQFDELYDEIMETKGKAEG